MAKLKSKIKPQIANVSIDWLNLSKFNKQTIKQLNISTIGELVNFGYERLVKAIQNSNPYQNTSYVIKEIQEKLAQFKARIKGSDFDVYDISIDRLDLPDSAWEVLDNIPKIKNLGDLANYGINKLINRFDGTYSVYETVINPINDELGKYEMQLNDSAHPIDKTKAFPIYKKILRDELYKNDRSENSTLEELNFGETIVKIMAKNNIFTLKELMSHSCGDVFKMLNKNFVIYNKLKEKLSKFNLQLSRAKQLAKQQNNIKIEINEDAEQKSKTKNVIEPKHIKTLGETSIDNFGFDSHLIKKLHSIGVNNVWQLLELKKNKINFLFSYRKAPIDRLLQVLKNHKIETDFKGNLNLSKLDLSEESSQVVKKYIRSKNIKVKKEEENNLSVNSADLDKLKILETTTIDNFGFDEYIIDNLHKRDIQNVLQLLKLKFPRVKACLNQCQSAIKRLNKVLENHNIKTDFKGNLDISELDLSEESSQVVLPKIIRYKKN